MQKTNQRNIAKKKIGVLDLLAPDSTTSATLQAYFLNCSVSNRNCTTNPIAPSMVIDNEY